MMSMRERRILAEAQDSERRVIRESGRLSLYFGPEKTIGQLIHARKIAVGYGYQMQIEWLLDSQGVPFGVRLFGERL
jgi:hypothetical protein